jgi:subtilisin family serine protease
MASKKENGDRSERAEAEPTVSSSVEELLLAANERGGDSLETGRYIMTLREDAGDEQFNLLREKGLRVADARDYAGQAARPEGIGDADAMVFPEIGSALVSGAALQRQGISAQDELSSDSPFETVEPEYFVFADKNDYLRGFLKAVETIAKDLESQIGDTADEEELEPSVLGATWGLIRCRVPASTRSGQGIKVAVLDTGLDLRHPDFAGRNLSAATFVAQPVQDLHSHGTHCIGTALGPLAPPGTTPRYGIAYRGHIFAGKVLSNSGFSVGGSVLAGMNWAVANRCQVISLSLGSASPVSAAYTAAGAAALRNGCLMIAAAGNAGAQTGSPANSPTILSIASLDSTLGPSVFSNFGKIEIAAPGRDVFSSIPTPRRYGLMSGTSMATPHVAGCAALWAQTSSSLRGQALWRKLQASARRLPFPAARVGAGLVQAP